MNYLGSSRVVTNSFTNHKTAEDYAGEHLSNILIYGKGKVVDVVNKFTSHEDSINYNDFLNNSKSWYSNGVYHCISVTGKETLMTSSELGGNQVYIETYYNNQKLIFHLAHLDSVLVNIGDIVDENTVIGLQGNTGLVLSSKDTSDVTYGSHVHLEITDTNNNYLDPRNYASGEIKTTYVEQTNQKDETKAQFKVLVASINIRETASVSATDLGNVYMGEIYDILDTVVDTSYTWYKIKTSTGITGYVATKDNWVQAVIPTSETNESTEEIPLIFECDSDDYYYIYLKKGEKLYLKS